MFGLMEPHLKRSTDQRKHIWKRAMYESDKIPEGHVAYGSGNIDPKRRFR